MSKFKIGDRVRITKFNRPVEIKLPYSYIGREFIIAADGGDYDGEQSWYNSESRSPSYPYRWKESELELVAPPAPIRTVTRREIVPGVYDYVQIVRVHEDGVNVFMNEGKWGANDLRSAAMIFSQIAEVLDENADNS